MRSIPSLDYLSFLHSLEVFSLLHPLFLVLWVTFAVSDSTMWQTSTPDFEKREGGYVQRF